MDREVEGRGLNQGGIVGLATSQSALSTYSWLCFGNTSQLFPKVAATHSF